MSAPKRVFLLSGWNKLPDAIYFPQLIEHLASKGCTVIKATQPVGDGDVDKAVRNFHSLLHANGGPGPDAYVIGQSIGQQTAMRGIAALPQGSSMGGLVCVGAWLDMAGATNESFAPWCDTSTLNFASLTAKCSGNIGVVYSTDDPVTGLGDAQLALFRQHLPAAKLLVASGRGHYIVPHLLPQELQFIDRILML
jgi:pimeloyl-ACP methyl ester carboxylesterase